MAWSSSTYIQDFSVNFSFQLIDNDQAYYEKKITSKSSPLKPLSHISGVMDTVLTSKSQIVRSSPNQVKPKTLKLVFVEHAAFRGKSKEWLSWIQNNVSEWSDMSTHRLLFQRCSTIKIQLSVLVYYKAEIIIVSSKCNLFSS